MQLTSKKELRRLHEGALRQLAKEREERATAEHRITYLQEQLGLANQSWAEASTQRDSYKKKLTTAEATIQQIKDALYPPLLPSIPLGPGPGFIPGIIPNRLGEPAPQFNFSFNEDDAVLDIKVVPNTGADQ